MKTSGLEFLFKNGSLAFVCKLSSGANYQHTLCGVFLDLGIPQGTACTRFDKSVRPRDQTNAVAISGPKLRGQRKRAYTRAIRIVKIRVHVFSTRKLLLNSINPLVDSCELFIKFLNSAALGRGHARHFLPTFFVGC